MNIIYIVCICFLLIVIGYLCKKLYDFSILILDIEDSVEESLDILNERYGSINKILQIPIFFDSVEVRQVVADIRDCHEAILTIANKLTNDIGLKGEIKEEDTQKEK